MPAQRRIWAATAAPATSRSELTSMRARRVILSLVDGSLARSWATHSWRWTLTRVFAGTAIQMALERQRNNDQRDPASLFGSIVTKSVTVARSGMLES